jgi:hypothetical protein
MRFDTPALERALRECIMTPQSVAGDLSTIFNEWLIPISYHISYYSGWRSIAVQVISKFTLRRMNVDGSIAIYVF